LRQVVTRGVLDPAGNRQASATQSGAAVIDAKCILCYGSQDMYPMFQRIPP
jgi:hypothetical protein